MTTTQLQHNHEPSLSLLPGCPRCEEIAGHLREERFDEAAVQRREDARVESGAVSPDAPPPPAAPAPDDETSPALAAPPLPAAAATPPEAVYPPRPTPPYCWLCSGAHDLLDCPRKASILQAGDQGAQVIRSVMKERGLVK